MNIESDGKERIPRERFWRRAGASCVGTLAGLFLFALLSAIGGIAFLSYWLRSDSSSPVKDKSILIFDLSTPISDTPPSSGAFDLLSSSKSRAVTLRQVIGAIEKAGEDPKIVGMLLYGRESSGDHGYATLAEIRKALETFRGSGKQIVAYDVDWSEKEYYLGSIASRVMISPVGMMEMNGLSSRGTFFAGAMEKYGIGVQVVRVGSFKGAVEPFTRNDFSPPNRQQIGVILKDIWSNYKSTIATSRQVSPEKLQTIADREGILEADEARNAGLVDEVAYFDRVIARLRELTRQEEGEKEPTEDFRSFNQVSLEDYAGSVTRAESGGTRKIAILYAEGEIVNGQGDSGAIGGDRYARELRKLRQDDAIKGVVLRINSPGGSATASDTILREVTRLREKKPVIVSMGDYAASGGYWMATGGQKIFAENNTLTGSIGVFGLLFNVQKIANSNGIRWDTVKTGRFADLETGTRPKTPEELKLYQESVNRFYNLFIEKVARSRRLSPERVRSLAGGRVWTGRDALGIGLIDEIGGLEAAVLHAAKVAKLETDWSIEEYPRPTTFEGEILSRLFQTYLSPVRDTGDPLSAEWLALREEVARFRGLNDPRGIYARLFFEFDPR